MWALWTCPTPDGSPGCAAPLGLGPTAGLSRAHRGPSELCRDISVKHGQARTLTFRWVCLVVGVNPSGHPGPQPWRAGDFPTQAGPLDLHGCAEGPWSTCVSLAHAARMGAKVGLGGHPWRGPRRGREVGLPVTPRPAAGDMSGDFLWPPPGCVPGEPGCPPICPGSPVAGTVSGALGPLLVSLPPATCFSWLIDIQTQSFPSDRRPRCASVVTPLADCLWDCPSVLGSGSWHK